MKEKILKTCKKLSESFHEISTERKIILQKIANYLQQKVDSKEPIKLMYVCTHNARRSHFGQVWSAVAAAFYEVPNVQTFSGGVEVTAFHPAAIRALASQGFIIKQLSEGNNPLYEVYFNEEIPVICFSKSIEDSANPKDEFIAVMVCGEAEQNCPFIPTASMRISTTYEDPKHADGTPNELEEYSKTSQLIGKELLYMYSLINK